MDASPGRARDRHLRPSSAATQAGKRNLNLRAIPDGLRTGSGPLRRQAEFDPEVTVRIVRLHVDMWISHAMSLLGSQREPFGAHESHIVFVVQTRRRKRRQYGPEASRPFRSPQPRPGGRDEMLRILRESPEQRASIWTSQRTSPCATRPNNLALPVELIQQLERARGEVMLEIETSKSTATKRAILELPLRFQSSSSV